MCNAWPETIPRTEKIRPLCCSVHHLHRDRNGGVNGLIEYFPSHLFQRSASGTAPQPCPVARSRPSPHLVQIVLNLFPPIGWSQVPSLSPTTAIAAHQVTGVSQVFVESKCAAAIDRPNLPITLAVRRNGLICYLLQAGSSDAVTRSRQVKQITTATMSLRHRRLSMCIGVPSPTGAYNLAL